MSKKLFVLATSRCGHCQQEKKFLNREFPTLNDENFTYFIYDVEEPTEQALAVLNTAKNMGVRGVPFTVLLNEEEKTIESYAMGFDPNTIREMAREVVGEE